LLLAACFLPCVHLGREDGRNSSLRRASGPRPCHRRDNFPHSNTRHFSHVTADAKNKRRYRPSAHASVSDINNIWLSAFRPITGCSVPSWARINANGTVGAKRCEGLKCIHCEHHHTAALSMYGHLN
jgi:hypothetical protein